MRKSRISQRVSGIIQKALPDLHQKYVVMKKSRITQRVVGIIQREYPALYELHLKNKSEAEILDMSIFDTTELDSLDRVVIILSIEQKLNVHLPRAENIPTMRMLVDCIYENGKA